MPEQLSYRQKGKRYKVLFHEKKAYMELAYMELAYSSTHY